LHSTKSKNMKKYSLHILTILFLSFASVTQAQDYHTALGVRLGGLTSGLTIRHFTNPGTALEGIVGVGHRAFILTGLYEKQRAFENAEGLSWFYGIGGHAGFFRYGGYYYYYHDHGNHGYYVVEEGATETVAGVDFILGLDYKIPNAPIDLGLDLKPFVDFWDGAEGYWDGALSIRFTF